jgi:RNA polymerase sigma-70 factor (ECF subfamily)
MKPAAPPTDTGFDPAKLIQEHQAGLWRYLRALGCPTELAEDLAQETFLAVLQKPFQNYNPQATRAYLRRVAYNLFVTQQRRGGRIVTVEDIEKYDAAWERWAGQDDGDAVLAGLKECLARLGERAQLALRLRFRERKSRQDIAAMLKMTEHGAKNLMQRAKKKLRECVEGKLGD